MGCGIYNTSGHIAATLLTRGTLMAQAQVGHTTATAQREFRRELGLFDSTMVVAGSMIGSGIYIVSADMARQLGSPGWLLLAWMVTGVLTITACLLYTSDAADERSSVDL